MTAERLDRAGSVPLWRQLQAELTGRIDADEFRDGFPGELVLAQEYQVSRHTVRQALRELRGDGRVVAERGRQPRVTPPTEIRQPLGALYSLFAAVRSAGLTQRSLVRSLDRRADGVVAERLGLEASTPLVYLERLRLAGDAPLALDRVWLPADYAAPLLTADFTETSLYGELAARVGDRPDSGLEELHAVVPTAAERALLECPAGAAVFSIHRLGRVRDRPVEWRHTVARGDRFGLTAQFGGVRPGGVATTLGSRLATAAGR